MERAWLDELAELIRIPSVSADAERAGDVRLAGEWVRDFVRRSGGKAELVETGAQPLVIGELRASQNAERAPTGLAYGHYDVQPPAPLDEWESPPFEATVRGEWLYGRGVADDKGQLYLLLKAAGLLASEGRLPVNVRIACDGEEEIGGHSVVDFLERDERGADACVIFDSDMIARGRPSFNVATRGLCYFHLKLQTGTRDLHSGIYGGAALNALHALTDVLSAVEPRNGRLPEQLRKGLVLPSDEEVASWASLPTGAHELASQGARPADDRAAEEFYRRTWAEPALDVNGVQGGSPQLQKTVLPVRAEANVSIRLAPGQQPEVIAREFERLLHDTVPEGAQLEVSLWSSAEPALVPPGHPALELASAAFERALGTKPLLIRSGGTLPIMPALGKRGIPAILTGFALPDSNIHSPNERLLLEYLPLGIKAAAELLLAFRELA